MMISVIVPVYNSQDHIKQCLDSILNQDYDNFELIVVNDGSTDDTLEILNLYKEKHDNLKVINISNHGQGFARNLAITKATGEYILFVDSDDYIKENCLEIISTVALKTNADIINFNYVIKELDGSIIKKPNFTDVGKKTIEGDCSILLSNRYYFSVNNLYNKKFINKNNIKFGEGYIYEDYEFWLKSSICSKKVVLLNDFLYVIVKNKNSSTKVNLDTNKHAEDFIKAVNSCFYVINQHDFNNENNLNYFYKYIFNRFFMYYRTRTPRKYKRTFAKIFVDTINKYNINNTNNKNYNILLKLNIFKKKKYFSFMVFCKLNEIRHKLKGR